MAAPKALRILHSAFLMVWAIVTTVLFTLFIYIVRPFSYALAFGTCKAWNVLLLLLCGVRLDVSGLEKIERGRNYIFMSNHLSALDISILYYALPFRITFMAKRELFMIPVFGWALAVTRHIPVDRSSPRRAGRAVNRAVANLKNLRGSLMVFPEGTRSRTGELGAFKLGVFSIAVDAGVPIIPVAIQGSREILPRGSYLINPSRVTVRIGGAVSTSGFTRKSKAALAAVVRDHLEDLLSGKRA